MNNAVPSTEEVLMEIDRIMNKESNLEQINTKINNIISNINEKQFVQNEWLITSHRKSIGKIIVFFKKIVRKLLRWYINPIIEQQNNYNHNISKLLVLINMKLSEIDNLNDKTNEISKLIDKVEVMDNLKDKIDTLKNKVAEMDNLKNKVAEMDNLKNKVAEMDELKNKVLEMDELKNKVAEMDELKNKVSGIDALKNKVENDSRDMIVQMQFSNDRLRRIERQINKKLDRTEENRITTNNIVERDKIENNDIDYFLFEQKYRGTVEDIKVRQKKYVDIFKGCKQVLDIGCGRGEFVELLTEEDIDVKGIDLNEDFVEYCKGRALNVEKDDLFDYLENCEDNSVGGIYCSQVIEHLTPEQMLKFIRLANKKLCINSPMVLETINPQNVVAVANWFYMDISHVRPVHPLTLEFILESEGFAKIKTLYLNKDEANSLPELKINDVKDSNLDEFNTKLNKVNDILFGAQDYAIICNKIYNN